MWTESVYLDAVAPDGLSGFVARMQRAPEVKNAWLWVHVFGPDGAFSFNDDQVPCDPARTDVEGPDPIYRTADLDASFVRSGPRLAMTGGSLAATVSGYRGLTAPLGAGPVNLEVHATFTPTRRAARGSLPGRTEEHGDVELSATWDGGRCEIQALGQWHEQHQELPRFGRPFTYLTLRGPDTAMVAVIGAAASGGWARRGETLFGLRGVRIDAPGPVRHVAAETDDGAVLDATLRTTEEYSVPIGGRPRPGTFVAGTLDGQPISGCANHWDPGEYNESGIPY